MKPYINVGYWFSKKAFLIICLSMVMYAGFAQDDSTQTETVEKPKKSSKPVKETFASLWILDNQTVMVPIKKTFQLDFMHRFGTWDNGYQDFFGLFGGINIRLGFNYVPIDDLMIGISFTEYNLTWEAYAKYAILKQTQDNRIPVSLSFYSDVSIDTKEDPSGTTYPHSSDRFMFFNQLLIARKINDRFSVQVAPSVTHVNTVQGYFTGDSTSDGKEVGKTMQHDHFAIAFSGKMKLSNTLNLLANYDQPITKHKQNNPAPNISVGLEINTSSHTFQVIIGNYRFITPSRNNYYNQNDPTSNGLSNFLIGFNLTRKWNF